MARVESIVELKKEYHEIVGFHAHAPITARGALESAGRIVALDEKLQTHKELPTDFFIAAVCTSQLLHWCEELQRAVTSGDRRSVQDTEALNAITTRFTTGNLETDEIKQMTAQMYVADPYMGAAKGMEILSKLHERFPEARFLSPQTEIIE